MNLPTVTPIRACRVTLPEGHPEGAGPCDVFTFLIRLHELRPRAAYFTHDATIWEPAPAEATT